jgi:hypothetical protein
MASQLVASRVVLSSIELVSVFLPPSRPKISLRLPRYALGPVIIVTSKCLPAYVNLCDSPRSRFNFDHMDPVSGSSKLFALFRIAF